MLRSEFYIFWGSTLAAMTIYFGSNGAGIVFTSLAIFTIISLVLEK